MNQSIIHAAAAVLTEGLKASIELQGLGHGRVKLTFTPNLGPTPDGASNEVINLRSAMSRPFMVSGSADEIEEAFAVRVVEASKIVQRGLSALDEIERLVSAAVDSAKAKTSVKPQDVQQSRSEDDDEDEANDVPPVGTPELAATGTTGTRF